MLYLPVYYSLLLEDLSKRRSFSILRRYGYQNCSELLTVRKKCSSDREKLLILEAEGQEFAKILRSQEQFVQTVKAQNKECFFNLFLEVSHI